MIMFAQAIPTTATIIQVVYVNKGQKGGSLAPLDPPLSTGILVRYSVGACSNTWCEVANGNSSCFIKKTSNLVPGALPCGVTQVIESC